ncbi:23S rRNA (uracil(1939)-C(5))-methyltransferase RlmD [Nitrogeniibacter aestuarii]|uniref:23S rRNA (uracil(1939)-C(5))-methyltransferase RlmD n=1 Tax=Nitrogeniibacter aestuarii TaxID=2815343 RepID=UPI001E55E160|nr:23S rRNA (uracil(1939)-C(5))-methyltransferase RlmD [Nitrogeniibacter aestuarii]
MPIAVIHALDHEGQGVSRTDEGKTLFIEGALPGETVEYELTREKPRFAKGFATRVIRRSGLRVEPRCTFFGHCGGCSMQHLDSNAQAAIKQRVLEDALWHQARVKPGVIYPAILGPAWAYRYRARLSVRWVERLGGVLVGFHERRSSYIADMTSCEVLPKRISALLPALRTLINRSSVAERMPQIELAIGDGVTILVFRILAPLSSEDEQRFRDFSDAHDIQIWLQPSGPDSAYRLYPEDAPALTYTAPEFDLRYDFRPNDFTQVNFHINRLLLRRAMQLLDPRPGERIADLFCGLGNFSLPIARRGAHVIGIEGSEALVERAAANAQANGLQESSEFYAANLFEATEDSLDVLGPLDKMLIDPPREGAVAVVKALGAQSPRRIVYVSCNPATLARDTGVLVHEKGYALEGAGIANMFPQTSHVESIALFERD